MPNEIDDCRLMSDTLMLKIQEAIKTSQSGLHDQARAEFDALVPLVGEDPLANCILAHYLADLQTDLDQELAWDLRSLSYLEKLSEKALQAFSPTLRKNTLYASIYLNIAEGFRKKGDWTAAAQYLELGEQSLAYLDDDGYGNLVKAALRRLRERLESKN